MLNQLTQSVSINSTITETQSNLQIGFMTVHIIYLYYQCLGLLVKHKQSISLPPPTLPQPFSLHTCAYYLPTTADLLRHVIVIKIHQYQHTIKLWINAPTRMCSQHMMIVYPLKMRKIWPKLNKWLTNFKIVHLHPLNSAVYLSHTWCTHLANPQVVDPHRETWFWYR